MGGPWMLLCGMLLMLVRRRSGGRSAAMTGTGTGNMELKFYSDLLSAPCRAVAIFMKINDIPYVDMHATAIRRGDSVCEGPRKVNLLHLVPSLVDSTFTISESCAILKYLCARYHLAGHWYPDDIKCRARVDEFLFWSVAHLHPCTSNIYNHQIVDPQMRNIPVDCQRLRRFHADLERALDRLEDTFLSAGHSYIADSDDPTLADVVAVCELTQAAAAGYDVVCARPQIAAWLPRIKTKLEPHFDVLSAPLYDAKKGLRGRFYQCENFNL